MLFILRKLFQYLLLQIDFDSGFIEIGSKFLGISFFVLCVMDV